MTQLYIALEHTNSTISSDGCFVAVKHWFASNGLSLNPDNSEAIVIGTSARHRSEGVVHVVTLGTDSITVTESIRSLGVTIDSSLSFNTHVNQVCKAYVTTQERCVISENASQKMTPLRLQFR